MLLSVNDVILQVNRYLQNPADGDCYLSLPELKSVHRMIEQLADAYYQRGYEQGKIDARLP